MQEAKIFEGFRTLIDAKSSIPMRIHGHPYTVAPLYDGFVAITAGDADGEILDVFRVPEHELSDRQRLARIAVGHLRFEPVIGGAA